MPRSTVRRPVFLALLAVFAGACASAGGERAGSGTSTTLSQEELVAAGGNNLYETLDRIRPRWLQARTVMSLQGTPQPQVLVYLNNSYVGGPDQLRGFQARDVVEVRYLDGPTASATLRGYDSSVHVAGAIVLLTTQRQ